MKLNELNRWKEFGCVINGHEFNERYIKSNNMGLLLEEHHTCGNCGLTIKDESGLIKYYKECEKLKEIIIAAEQGKE